MNMHTGEKYVNCRIELDDHSYENCRFESCTFVYRGTGVIQLVSNDICGSFKLEFAGAAGRGIEALADFYKMGFKDQVISLIRGISPEIARRLH